MLAIAAALWSAACSSADDVSGDVHLELVQAPETAAPGSPEPQPIVVKVVSEDGSAAPGVPVRWTVRSGGGHLQASADTSGLDGLAAVQWLPGLAAGSQEIGVYLYDQPALVITVNAAVLHADKLSTSFERGCGLQGTAVWCWRDDYPARPTQRILPQYEAKDIAATYQHACILDAAGTVYCNRAFEGTDPQASSTISGLPPLKSLSGGGRYFCGVALADETAWCWRDFEMVAWQESPSPALSNLSVGGTYVCGLELAGSAWCWSLPLGSPTLVPGGHVFRSVSADDDYPGACGVEGAALWCWYGSETPTPVAGVSAVQVALAWPFALLNTGPVAVTATVLRNFGQGATVLGLEVFAPGAFPGPVRQVYPTCVLTYDNEAYCLATENVNVDVFPLPAYWKAVAAPQP